MKTMWSDIIFSELLHFESKSCILLYWQHYVSECLYSLMYSFMVPTQPVEIFRNVSSPFVTLATQWHSWKILRRSSQGSPPAAQLNIGGAFCKSSVIPFLVPCCNVWLTPTAPVPCSNAANIGECKTWTQSEFCPIFALGKIPSGARAPKNVHRDSKNVPPFACYNFDTHERILIFFGRNTTDKVSNQKALYYVTSNNLCFCTTWQNGKHENCIFQSLY